MIREQNTNVDHLDKAMIIKKKKEIKTARDIEFQKTFLEILENSSEEQKIVMEMTREKGSYLWLSALPLKCLGYVLNKEEFQDAVALRYNWNIPRIPKQCACGVSNNVDHLLICKKGGYVTMRHDAIRDTEADLLKEICRDVRTEPTLIPTKGDHLRTSTEKGYQARLDIVATGLWSNFERTYFDVRITYPNAPSNRSKNLTQLYETQEKEKKRKYEERVIEVEKGSFCPLIFSTSLSLIHISEPTRPY